MKKVFSALIFASLAVMLIISASAQTYLMGDLNGDNKVNATDARFALRAAARLETLTDVQKIVADVNNDKKVTTTDARIILRIGAKIEASLGEIVIGEEPTTKPEDPTEPTTKPEDPTEPTTKPEEPTDPPVSDAIAYNDFPNEMKSFLSGSFGFDGRLLSKNDAMDMSFKTDGKNTKMSTSNIDLGGDSSLVVSVLMKTEKNVLGKEKTTTYIISENNKKYMDMDTLKTQLKIMTGEDFDLGFDVDIIAFGISKDKLASLTATCKKATIDNTEYDVYCVAHDDLAVDFYYADGKIREIITYNDDATVAARFIIDKFYAKVSSDDFSLKKYTATVSLITLFPIEF